MSLRNSKGQFVIGQRVKLTDYRSVVSLEKAIDVLQKQGFDFSYHAPGVELTETQKRAAVIEKLVQEVAALKAAQAKQ